MDGLEISVWGDSMGTSLWALKLFFGIRVLLHYGTIGLTGVPLVTLAPHVSGRIKEKQQKSETANSVLPTSTMSFFSSHNSCALSAPPELLSTVHFFPAYFLLM